MLSTSTSPSQSVELLTSPWESLFYNLVDEADEQLLIASPFISGYPLKKAVEIVERKSPVSDLQIHIVTNLAVDSLLSGSLDSAALLYVLQSVPGSIVTYIPSLHAKVYIADDKVAVVTSANLTKGGLSSNREYGVLLRDQVLVRQVRTDLTKYATLGNRVSIDTLTALSQATEELQDLRKKSDKSVRQKLRMAFEERADAAKLELLKARARDKTTHSIFCDTVLYLLEQKGPLRTVELNPLVQQIHPDLCDDSVDRVIDGVHFGKKWKHYVRNAQQALKRRGLVDFDGKHWFLR